MNGLKHQMEKRSMDYFAGLDVSVKETSICIVDDTGRIVREAKVASEPDALLEVLKNPTYSFKRIGLEAGPLSQWLYSAFAEVHLPVICVETRHMRSQKLRMLLTHREARIRELVKDLPDIAILVEPLLVVRRVLREQIAVLHRRLLAIVRDDAVCRRLMTVPGVGPVALARRLAVIMHRIWVDGTEFCWTREIAAA